MKREEISAALGGIDDKYIEEATDLPTHRPVHIWARRLVPLAACLAVVLTIGRYQSYLEGSMKGEVASGESAPTEGSTASSECTGAPEDQIFSVVVKVQGKLADGFTGAVVETECDERYPMDTEVQVYFKEHDAETESYEGIDSQKDGEQDDMEQLVRVRFSASEADSDSLVLYAEEIEILN